MITDKETRLQTSKSVLTLPLKPKHFRQRSNVNDKISGQLRAKCLASMLTMHWQSEDIVITEESPTLASVVDSSDKKKNATIDTNKEDGGKDSASSSGNFTLIMSSLIVSLNLKIFVIHFILSFQDQAQKRRLQRGME